MKNNQINIQASVIVVNFNNEKYVNRCLNSLHKQNYKNFEIIFVDDSSTDNSIISANKFNNP